MIVDLSISRIPSSFHSFLKSIGSVVTEVGTHADLLGPRRTAVLKAVDSRVQNLFLAEIIWAIYSKIWQLGSWCLTNGWFILWYSCNTCEGCCDIMRLCDKMWRVTSLQAWMIVLECFGCFGGTTLSTLHYVQAVGRSAGHTVIPFLQWTVRMLLQTCCAGFACCLNYHELQALGLSRISS